MKTALVLLFAAFALVGCETMPKKEDPRVVAFEAGKKTVQLDKRYLAECPDLPLLPDSTDKLTLDAIEKWGSAYQSCRAWKHELNKVVRDAFNIDR